MLLSNYPTATPTDSDANCLTERLYLDEEKRKTGELWD